MAAEIARDLWAQAERQVAKAFQALESDSTVVQGDYSPRVDGGRVGSPMERTASGGMVEAAMARLPKEQQAAIRASYQGRGILDGMREKRVRWKERDGIKQKEIETKAKFSARRLRDLSRWEESQLWQRRQACHELAAYITTTLPPAAVVHLVLEWSGNYSDYATQEVAKIANCHPSTVSRARKRVYQRADELRKAGIWGIAQRVERGEQ